MGQFFKFMFASMLGFILGSLVIALIFAIAIVGAIASAGSAFTFESRPATVKEGSVLLLQLDKAIVDRGRSDGLDLDFGPFAGAGELGLNEVLHAIEQAGTDERIKGIFMDLGMVDARMATMREIREKLVAFRKESGKPVIAYGEVFTQGTYFLASAADSVFLVPEGDLDFRGLQVEMMFFKGMFDKLGVDVQFIRGSNNRFKSYGEAFIQDRMSDDNRRQMTELIGGLWTQYRAAIADARNIPADRLDQIADSMLVRHAPDAVRLGLVDGLKYRDEVIALVKERMGLPADKELVTITEEHYATARVPVSKGGHEAPKGRNKVAVVYAQGDIMPGESSSGTIGSTTIADAIREAREDSTVKAIVLRVNSPGGSGLASDIIWREVTLAKAAKPVVVSMGDLAASGGYYISCAADRIYAQPGTITGSIGVFGMIPNMQGFFNDKLGITFDGVKTNRFADMMTINRALTADERTIIQGYVDRFYDTFKARVAEGRRLSPEAVDSIGQGRVWTGERARDLGLVDEIGGLEDAIAGAAGMAGIAEDAYRVMDLPRQEPLLEELMKSLGAEARIWLCDQAFGKDAELLQRFEAIRRVRVMGGVQARIPYDPVVH
jgi:protease-4